MEEMQDESVNLEPTFLASADRTSGSKLNIDPNFMYNTILITNISLVLTEPF